MTALPISVPTNSVADQQLALILEQVTARIQAGESLDADVLAADHPEFAERLRQLLPAMQLLADASRPDGTPISVPGDFDETASGALGDFQLIREVGRGGMGIVYEAEQISLNRKVALKVLPFAATMDPRQLQRFRNEAQAAACLHHPNIVPVHGVGCDRGVHYYAMQLIEGQTLAEVIKNLTPQPPSRSGKGEQEPSPPFPLREGGPGGLGSTVPNAFLSTKRDRAHFRHIAELIASAADALEYAHSMGVVHRDIKPGNLMLDSSPSPLVGEGWGGGSHLWITDFGLAKLASPARQAGEITLTGDLIGTLRYMSPEQALARHGLVDHRTDVYSLGATLYELLTLRPAVEGADKAEILKHIAFEEPIALRKLDKSIPGELETITLKALAKEPAERYATAGEFAADLKRLVADQPIRARRPTLKQKFTRSARRHPGLVAALGLTAGLLLAGSWAWHRETTNAEKAAFVVAAESDQLRDADRLPEALAVARRAADLLPRFGGDAGLRHAIEGRVADLKLLNRLEEVRSGGFFDYEFDNKLETQRIGTLFRQAFQVCYGIDLLGGDERAVTEVLRQRPIAAQIAAALSEQGVSTWRNQEEELRLVRLVEALDTDPRRITSRTMRESGVKDREALKRLAAEAEADLPPAPALVRLGLALESVSCFAEAERLLRAGQKRYPADALLNQTLASVLYVMGPVQQAESIGFFRTALALRPHLPSGWYNLGTALGRVGDHPEAVATLQRAIALMPDHAAFHVNLGVALVKLGRRAEAEAAYRRAIELEPDDPVVRNNLGGLLYDFKKPDEAAAEFRRAIELKPKLAESHDGLGQALRALGRLADAEKAFRQAVLLKSQYAEAQLNLANVLLDQGETLNRDRLAEVEANVRPAMALAPDHLKGSLGMACYRLGAKFYMLGRPADAEPFCRRAVELFPDHAQANCNLGLALQRLGRFAESVPLLRRGHELGTKEPGWNYPSERWLRRSERLAELETKLPAILAGTVQPVNTAESILLAEMCKQHKQLYAAAARFLAHAFAAEPKLADDIKTGHRYNAACAAALAGCGQGEDGAKLDDAERARLRRQAQEWLAAELVAWRKLAENPAERPKLRQIMQHWQQDSDLAGVRDDAALAKLPEAERATWQKLWADVAELLKRAEEPKAPEKPPPKP